MKLEITNKWNAVSRILNITLLEIKGNLTDVPVNKTYQHWFKLDTKFVTAKLNIEENGLVTQRIHNLYKSSKKGYYCIVCKQKCYFTNDEINSVYKESEVEHKH